MKDILDFKITQVRSNNVFGEYMYNNECYSFNAKCYPLPSDYGDFKSNVGKIYITKKGSDKVVTNINFNDRKNDIGKETEKMTAELLLILNHLSKRDFFKDYERILMAYDMEFGDELINLLDVYSKKNWRVHTLNEEEVETLVKHIRNRLNFLNSNISYKEYTELEE